MFSLEGAVSIIVFLLVGAAIFGLLYLLIIGVSKLLPEGAAAALFIRYTTGLLYVLAVLVLIGLLLSFITGKPLFRP